MQSQRIWELDAFRGVCILGVIFYHLLFDLGCFLGLTIPQGTLLTAMGRYGGVLFVILSGICVTLGRRSLRRGFCLLGIAMGITAVTALLARCSLLAPALVIRFGVLHLLGSAMLLWPLFRNLPTAALTALGAMMAITGSAIADLRITSPLFFPLGLTAPGFCSGDYFPLLPHLGWFLLGAALGRTLYREHRSLLLVRYGNSPAVRFLRTCGQHSLWIYLLHQPILLAGIAMIRQSGL